MCVWWGVVAGMDIHKILRIEDSWVVKQGVICDGRRIHVKSFKELLVLWLLNV